MDNSHARVKNYWSDAIQHVFQLSVWNVLFLNVILQDIVYIKFTYQYSLYIFNSCKYVLHINLVLRLLV